MKTISFDKKQKMKNGKRVNAIRHFSLLLFLFSFAFTSCSKEDVAQQFEATPTTTFTLSIDELQTRTTSTVTPVRHVMEVWSEDGTTAENVFENGTNHAEITSGNAFTVVLDKEKAYTCLFWADGDVNNTAGVYNATALKTISLNSGKEFAEAYHAQIAVAKGKNPAVTVTLKRAVAKITLTETLAVKETTNIALRLSNVYPSFNVMTGAASGTAAVWNKTITPSVTVGTIATLYFFAKPEKELLELAFTYGIEPEKTVSNIPFQQNFATNIKGEYSAYNSFVFTITADDEWNTPDYDVNFRTYKVGDIYFKGTTPIGVVFWVDETNASYNAATKASAKGKIVGLDELTNTLWSTEKVATSATSATDGAANTAKVLALATYTAEKYPAFAWCNAKNTPAVAGISWYIPAIEDLRYGLGGDNQTVLNAALSNIPGAALLSPTGYSGYYWSSTEDSDSKAHKAALGSFSTASDKTSYPERFRVVSAF